MSLAAPRVRSRIGVGLTAVLLVLPAVAATLHVWQESPSPTPPYADWATAAHVIQDAVDAAQTGDTVLVTNGVYATGGRPAPGSLLTNRVIIEKPLVLLSVNGPAATLIEGAKRQSWMGDGATRCVYLATSAVVISGFTVTNGSTLGDEGLPREEKPGIDHDGAGLFAVGGGTVTNCVVVGNRAIHAGGGVLRATLYDCQVMGNSALWLGGGVAGCWLSRCTVEDNWAYEHGGGAGSSTLRDCILRRNVTHRYGGGGYDCTMYDSLIEGNEAVFRRGGGVSASILHGCELRNNLAGDPRDAATRCGGGADNSTLNNCLLAGNRAGGTGRMAEHDVPVEGYGGVRSTPR